MIESATMCYWALKVEQLQMNPHNGLVPKHADTRLLPPCFHRTLRGTTFLAEKMRLVEDNEIRRMLDEADRREDEEEDDKIKVLKESTGTIINRMNNN
jgi:hypothetical protein